VIDGSLAMKPYRDTVAGALAPARPGCRLALFAAERERLREQAAAEWTTDAGAAAAALVRGIAFAGAQDNTDALAKAWDFASGATDGVVLWVHGHAYERLGDPESIRQRLERRKPGPRIVSLQLADGPNRLVEKLDRLAVFELATRDGDAAGDTAATVRSLFAPSPILVERHLAADGETTDATSSSPHPSRLRARAEALALLVTTRPADAAAAGALAARYALVTPASGAVVLESAQQFREAGLEPVDPSSVTVVPEPSALTLLALGALLAARRRRPPPGAGTRQA
jgi:MYXO-CTERM domain-containing protein